MKNANSPQAADERSSPVLGLYDVLEDEYRALHGALPDKYLECKAVTLTDKTLKDDERNERLVECMYDCLHERAAGKNGIPRTALCLSGGGIRSGAFSLGVLQGLARHNLLDRFDYLSTVSGGGYIGSWLTGWIHREGGLRRVTEALKRDNPADVSAIDPEPEPIRHLRAYSNFLTPRTGLLSADAWTFGAIFLRNLLINWTVLIPLLLAVLCVPRIAASNVSADPSLWLQIVVLVVGVVAGALGVSYIGLNQPSTHDAAKDSAQSGAAKNVKGQKSFLWQCLFPLMLSAVCLTSCWAWHTNPMILPENRPERFLSQWFDVDTGKGWRIFFGLCAIGVILNLLGWLIYTAVRRRFGLTTLGTLLISIITGFTGGALVFAATRTIPFITDPHVNNHALLYTCFAFPLFLVLFLIAIAFISALTSRDYWRVAVKDEDREWWSRCSGWLLIATAAWTVFGVTVIFGPSLLLLIYYGYYVLSLGLGSGLLTLLGGRSAATPATADAKGKSWTGFLVQHAVTLAAPVFLLFFVILLALVTDLILLKAAGVLSHIDSMGNFFKRFYPSVPDYSVSTLLTKGGTTHLAVVRETPWWLSLGIALVSLGVGWFAAQFINLNKFSLHYAYRNRLVRAFLGASRKAADRNPNPFTGFDLADNIYMHELRPGLLSIDNLTRTKKTFIDKLLRENPNAATLTSETTEEGIYQYIFRNLSPETRDALAEYDKEADEREPMQSLVVNLVSDLNKILESRAFNTRFGEAKPATTPQGLLTLINRVTLEKAFPGEIEFYDLPQPPHKLMHVINLTLNLVAGDNLAWQQRRAEPFTVSPLHSGNFNLGYRTTNAYGGTEGISLGTAATISGAAVNPNMGYHSSPLVTFILTLFNVRLGWWLGNTGEAGEKAYRYSHPLSAVRPIIAEAFGLTDDKSSYINLSDGGHFENLGLYEMVLRRCHIIVVVDGSQDEDCQLDDLGNAVRKIRVDLGIPINFDDKIKIYSRKLKCKGDYCAVAEIDYASVDGSEVDPGKLIYIKTAFYGDEPPDIFNYAQQHEAFPHEGTIDQFYDESQFESYRMLGRHVISTIWGDDRHQQRARRTARHKRDALPTGDKTPDDQPASAQPRPEGLSHFAHRVAAYLRRSDEGRR